MTPWSWKIKVLKKMLKSWCQHTSFIIVITVERKRERERERESKISLVL